VHFVGLFLSSLLKTHGPKKNSIAPTGKNDQHLQNYQSEVTKSQRGDLVQE